MKRKKLRLEYMDPEQLRENPLNWRTHPKEQKEHLKESLDRVGWAGCILYNERTKRIIDGHLRRNEAIERNEKAPVLIGQWTEAEEKLILASFDPITNMAGIDEKILDSLLGDVSISFPDVDLTGMFKGIGFTTSEPEITQDEPPEPPTEPKSKRGEIYQLGKHRLMCGDATNKEDVSKLMGGKKADMVFTSPPYNLGVSAKLRGNTEIAKRGNVYENHDDNMNQEKWLELIIKSLETIKHHSTYQFYNIQMLAGNKESFFKYINNVQNHIVDIMVWDKQHAPPAVAEHVMNSRYEFIFITTNENKPSRAIKIGNFRGTINNLYAGSPQRKNEYSYTHGATFPIELPVHILKSFSPQTIIDNFGGTGTTLIACEQLNRICYMMEIDPKYIDVIIQRWENFTGKKAELISE